MNLSQHPLSYAIAAVLSGVLVAPMSASAEEKAAKGLEEVIVTARKTEENIQAIPVAITSLSGDDLQKAGVFDVRAVSQQTPSLNITAAVGNPNSARVSLRGQVQNDTIFTVDPSVGIYLDEVYVGRAPGALLDMYDVQRVEVLKGPQGTLYGRNTTGGALKIITNKAEPGAGVGGFLKAGVGNYNSKRVEGAINIPLIEDKLAVRIAGLINKRDGYSELSITDPITGAVLRKLDTDDKNTQSVRTDFMWNITDKLELELNFDYSDINTNGALTYNRLGDIPGVPQSGLTTSVGGVVGNSNYVRSSNDPLKARENVTPYAKNRAWGGSLTSTYTFDNDIVAKAVYAHRKMDGDYIFGVDGTSMLIIDAGSPFGQKQDSVELQLSGNSFDSLDWVAGAFWFRETGYESSGQTLFGIVPAPGVDLSGGALQAPYDATGENKSKSGYGQATWHFTDTLSFTGGLRWTGDTKSLVSHNYTRLGIVGGGFTSPGSCNFTAGTPGVTVTTVGGVLTECESDQSHNYKHWSWTAGIDWQVLDDVMVYAKSSNGYRAGGQNLRGKSERELVPFGAETVTDIEVGAKSTLWENRLRANLAIYHSNYKDIQSTVFLPAAPGAPSATQVVNLSNAEIDGGELELTAQVLDELVLTATGSYIDVAYTTKLDGAAAASYPLGLQSSWTPRWKYAFGGTYTQQLGGGELSYNLNYTWRDGYWANNSKTTNQTPEAWTDSIGLVNARVALNLAAIDTTVGVWGTNLANKRYVGNNLLFSAGGPTFVSTGPMEPRMFGIDVNKKF